MNENGLQARFTIKLEEEKRLIIPFYITNLHYRREFPLCCAPARVLSQ